MRFSYKCKHTCGEMVGRKTYRLRHVCIYLADYMIQITGKYICVAVKCAHRVHVFAPSPAAAAPSWPCRAQFTAKWIGL